MKICQNCNCEYVGRANKYCSPECATAAHKAQVEARAAAAGACPVCASTDRNPVTGVCRPCNKTYAKEKRWAKAKAEGRNIIGRNPVSEDGSYTCYRCGSNDFNTRPSGTSYCRPCLKRYQDGYVAKMTPLQRAKWKTQQKMWWAKNTGAVSQTIKEDRSSAAPDWLTDEHWDQISDVYEKADRMTMLGGDLDYHVDHIVPIKGTNVCGLHVPWNLQVLESRANIRKGNRYSGDDAW